MKNTLYNISPCTLKEDKYILANKNEEIFSFFTIVFSCKLKNTRAIQAQLLVIYVSMFQKLTYTVLL